MSNIAMQGGATGSGTVTLLAPVTNTNRTINLPDSNGTVLTTATAGVPVNGPAVSAYKNSGSQSITSATFTKVTFDAEVFDTNNCFASSTFTPTVAGYYQINTGLSTSGVVAQTRVIITIYKNGSAVYSPVDLSITSFRYSGGALIYMNGSTDTIEIYTYVAGTSPAIESGTGSTGYNTYFQAALVRSAT